MIDILSLSISHEVESLKLLVRVLANEVRCVQLEVINFGQIGVLEFGDLAASVGACFH